MMHRTHCRGLIAATALSAAFAWHDAHAVAFGLEQVLYNPAAAGPSDRFGFAVAIDNGQVIVGRNSDDPGVDRVDVFDAASGNLIRTIMDPTPNVPTLNAPYQTTNFGSAVDIQNGAALIGAFGNRNTGPTIGGRAHLIDVASGNVIHQFNAPTPSSSGAFGRDVALDGNWALISEPQAFESGRGAVGEVHIFDITTGQHQLTIVNPDSGGADQFGFSVALDGANVLVGAWLADRTIQNTGTAYLFDGTTGNLIQEFGNPTPAGNEEYGSAVAVEGNRVLIGAPQVNNGAFADGEAYLFDTATGNLIATLGHPFPDNTGRYGEDVALFGGVAFVGSNGTGVTQDPGEPALGGFVDAFNALDGSFLGRFENPTVLPGDPLFQGVNITPAIGDAFGAAIAVDEDFVIAGASTHDAQGFNDGLTFVFRNELTAPVPAPGSAVMLGAAIAAVGFVAYRRKSAA